MSNHILEISLFGPCIVRSATNRLFEIKSAKHKALLVVLATSPGGCCTCETLQSMLWGLSSVDPSDFQNLRKAKSDISKVIGREMFASFFREAERIYTVDVSKVKFSGDRTSGEFLAGMNVQTRGFKKWLLEMRDKPEKLDHLLERRTSPFPRMVMPRVAVMLPVTHPDDTDSRFMGDWLASEIIRALSRSNAISVISHLSSRQFETVTVDVTALQEVLGADFLVTSMLPPSTGTRVFTAALNDLTTGEEIPLGAFSGKAEDFLGLNPPGIQSVVANVSQAISNAAFKQVVNARALCDVDLHRVFMAGVRNIHAPKLGAFLNANVFLKEVVERAPTSVPGHAWLAKWYILHAFNGKNDEANSEAQLAIDHTNRALELDELDSFSLTMQGFALNNLFRDLDTAHQCYSEALQINPNEAVSWLLKSMVHAFRDEGELAIEHVTQARLLSPIDPFGYFFDSLEASAQLSVGNFETALDRADASLKANHYHVSTARAKITALHNLDRMDEARAVADDLLRRNSNMTVKDYRRDHPAAQFKLGTMVADALLASGIPEGE